MAKPRIYGSNAVFIPNNRRDRHRKKYPVLSKKGGTQKCVDSKNRTD